MSANTTAEVTARSRPPIVDYAVYALILRCVFSLGAALALYGARDEVTRSLADANKDKHWSAQTLHDKVDAALRANVISTLVMIVLVAIMIKFVRDGRNWARWLYLAFAILITRDIFQVFGFFQYDDFLTRVLTGLVGLSSIAALALLFLPESNAYFRPAGSSSGGLLGGMFGARGAMTAAAARSAAAGRPASGRSGSAGRPRRVASEASPSTEQIPSVQNPGQPVVDQSLDQSPLDQPVGGQPAAGRTPPRGKSRQSGKPGGQR